MPTWQSLEAKKENMQRHFKRLFCLIAISAIAFQVSPSRAQMTGGATTGAMAGNGGTGTSGGANGMQASPGFTNKSDLISAIAPPFDVDDVLRMHRVGLQDEVIVNALRLRYHPLILTGEEKTRLKNAGVSERVIDAMEDPYGIGLANVRANMEAAEGAPPVAETARQAWEANPHRPKLHTRPSQNVGGHVYVGQSHPPSEPILSGSDAANSSSAPASGFAESKLDLSTSPATRVLPEPVMKVVSKPIGPGVYLRHGSAWERVDEEPVYWHHHIESDKDIEGSVLRPQSATQAYPGGSDFLFITANGTSAIQYELVRLKQDVDKRTFRPAPAGQVYNAGGGDLVQFNPQQLGPSSWLVSLRGVSPGEYGFLPPVTSQVHSTTNLATTLYSFRVK